MELEKKTIFALINRLSNGADAFWVGFIFWYRTTSGHFLYTKITLEDQIQYILEVLMGFKEWLFQLTQQIPGQGGPRPLQAMFKLNSALTEASQVAVMGFIVFIEVLPCYRLL